MQPLSVCACLHSAADLRVHCAYYTLYILLYANRCQLHWESDNCLLIAWGDTFMILQVVTTSTVKTVLVLYDVR
jgi:hypothetical protein